MFKPQQLDQYSGRKKTINYGKDIEINFVLVQSDIHACTVQLLKKYVK